MVLSSLVPSFFDQIRIFAPSNFLLEIKTFFAGKNNENLPEFHIFSNIYDHHCLTRQFFAILENQGEALKCYFRYFSHFMSYLQFGCQKLPFIRKFGEINQFLNFQKNDVYKKWNIRPWIEIKYIQVVKIFWKVVFLGSTWNLLAHKSVDRAEISKNYLLRKSWS